jgi:type III pantothenate kinase
MYYIDIGNSRIKIKSWVGSSWQEQLNTSTENARGAAEYILRKGESAVGISVVPEAVHTMNEVLTSEEHEAQGGKLVRWLTAEDIPAKSMDYETPETLGLDRYMACLGAFALEQRSVIVVDAGTACTLDYMDDSGIYRGGVIMPGIGLWEKSLQQYAPNLPQVVRDAPHHWPGKSTEASLRWGIGGAFIIAIDGIIQRYDNLAKVYVTGGDAHWLARNMQRSGKVNDNLIFHGMKKLIDARLWFSG